jgi:hypothetical protein
LLLQGGQQRTLEESVVPPVTCEHAAAKVTAPNPSNKRPPTCPTKPLPISSEEIGATAFDKDPNRLLVVQIYNQVSCYFSIFFGHGGCQFL